MSFIYVILGIVGWCTAAVVVPLYLVRKPSGGVVASERPLEKI